MSVLSSALCVLYHGVGIRAQYCCQHARASGATTSGGGGAGTFSFDLSGALSAVYGIYQDTLYPTTISVYINGTDRTTALGGPWASGGASVDVELEITDYLAQATGGLRQNHTVQFRCSSGQGEIEAEIDMLVSIQAIAVV